MDVRDHEAYGGHDDTHQKPRASGEGREIFETRPLASFGYRSLVEVNNPDLGPTAEELRAREKDMTRR